MRVVVVGAGVAGLAAARALVARGDEVTVFDKGRSPGGRMATRRIGTARFDHGAEFFTVRTETFERAVAPLVDEGLVYEWCRGFEDPPDGHPRYAVRGGMNALAKTWATTLDVRCGSMVFAIRPDPRGWCVCLDDGSSTRCDAVVVTCPLPQSYSLLITAGLALPEALMRGEYDRTLAVLAVLDRPPAIGGAGGVQRPTPRLSFASDNQRKGVSDVPALTVHADPVWSESLWDQSPGEVAAAILNDAAPLIGPARVTEVQLKKWRFATPRVLWPERCWLAPDGAPVVLAGDAFAGPRVEGAVLSGFAAADALAS